MQILINENGYVDGFAFEGNIVGGIEIQPPENLDHFAEYYSAYCMAGGLLSFDEKRLSVIQHQEAVNEYRRLRETECFSVINRGEMWYGTLTETQKAELQEWYLAWLNGTETLIVPEKPTWLN